LFCAHSSSEVVSRDSLASLITPAFNYVEFTPALANYQAMVSSGEIGLVQDDSLLVFLNQFETHLATFDWHTELAGDVFFTGPVYDMKRELGTIESLIASDSLQAFVRRRSVGVAAESFWMIQSNWLTAIRQMERAAAGVVRQVDSQLQAR